MMRLDPAQAWNRTSAAQILQHTLTVQKPPYYKIRRQPPHFIAQAATKLAQHNLQIHWEQTESFLLQVSPAYVTHY
jgi:hypothetical protein